MTTYHYDDFDRVTKETSPVQGVTTYVYDADNNLTSMTDANAATTKYTYDPLNRVLTETATKTGSTTLSTTWRYDDPTTGHFGSGRLATMVDPSGSSAYSYERRGNVAVENRTITSTGFTQAYTYDGNANRATVTYPDGYVVTTGYDYADRPVSSSHTSTLTSAQLAALAATGLAAPANAATPETATRRTESSVAVRTIPLGGATGGRRIAIGGGSASGLSIGRSQPAAVHTLAVSPDTFVSAATYKPFGPIATVTFGNGTTQTLSWNNRYFPTENKLTAAGTLADYTYSEDHVGNITAITDAVNAAYDRSFAYDDLNRLTTANAGASLWGTASNNGYTYDAMGNIKTRRLGSGKVDLFTYKAGTGASVGLPEIANTVENGTTRTVTYDAFGNELGDGGSTFTYSPRELTATDSRYISAYYYDGFRRRVATKLKSNSNQRDTFFDGTRLLAESTQFTTAAPTIQYKYVWLGERPVAQVDAGGTHWTFADHLGTPLIQTSSSASITYQVDLEPYGKVYKTRTGSTLHQPLRFPGQSAEQFDSGDNGLTERSYNNARWYRPQWGRYTQPDPLRIGVKSTNLYRYAKDDPGILMDPSGLYPIPGGLGGLYGIPAPSPPPPDYFHNNTLPGQGDELDYGNYCGAFRTNGKDMSQFPLGPSQIGGPNNPPAVDGVDACCLTHDQDRARCYNTPCIAKNSRDHAICDSDADRKAARCIGRINTNNNPFEHYAQQYFGGGLGISGGLGGLRRLVPF